MIRGELITGILFVVAAMSVFSSGALMFPFHHTRPVQRQAITCKSERRSGVSRVVFQHGSEGMDCFARFSKRSARFRRVLRPRRW